MYLINTIAQKFVIAIVAFIAIMPMNVNSIATPTAEDKASVVEIEAPDEATEVVEIAQGEFIG